MRKGFLRPPKRIVWGIDMRKLGREIALVFLAALLLLIAQTVAGPLNTGAWRPSLSLLGFAAVPAFLVAAFIYWADKDEDKEQRTEGAVRHKEIVGLLTDVLAAINQLAGELREDRLTRQGGGRNPL